MATNVGGYGLCRGRRLRYSDFFAARGYAFAMDTADLPPEDGPEAEFARRIAAGPPGSSVDAEAGLYRLLAPRVRRYGQRHLRDEHAAEDLMQHVMAMTIELLQRYAGDVPMVDVHVAPRLDHELVAQCLERLPERERAVLVLSFYDEQPAEEVALSLGLTAGNVRVIRHRGIDKLRRCVASGRRAA